jgi:VIT1/CCC1 family predicted Fe2+/Mn2+ transporter
METKFKSFLVAIIASITCLFTIKKTGYFIENEIQQYFLSVNLETSFFILISFAISNLILLFFSNVIFKLWISRIISWFLPMTIIFLLTTSSGWGSMVSPGRVDYAIFLGVILILVTLVFAFAQKFYFKR